MKIKAYSLSQAYEIASKEFNCLAADISVKIIIKPKSGLFGLFKQEGEFEAVLTNQSAQIKPTPSNKQEHSHKTQKLNINDEILLQIKNDLQQLLSVSDFSVCISDVSLYNDKIIFIKLDGEDSALLIGKEGYRYNALYTLLHNWLDIKYGFGIRLEIAEFLKNQEAGMNFYLEGIIKKVNEQGYASTKKLDGILLKIALEKLRAQFPQKYVGIKNTDDGKYILINDFHKK